jgi:hypothetical protein
MKKAIFLMPGLLLACVMPLAAHHSFAAEFDVNQKVSFSGTVVKIEWMNPHTWIYVDVKDDKGNTEHWQCETGAPVELVRKGWRKDSLKVGDKVTVNGFRAKAGGFTANAREVILPDGKQVFSGSSDDGGPQPRVGAPTQ